MPTPRVWRTPGHRHLLGPCHRPVLGASKDHTLAGRPPTGTLGFSDRAEHAKSGLRGLWAVAGSSLQEEGQALSFSQRSLLKVTVTRGRLSQSQCLGTLCLKGKGGRAKRKKRSVFSSFPTYILGLYNSTLAFQRDG